MVNFTKLFNYLRPALNQETIKKKPWLPHRAERSNKQDASRFIRSRFLRTRLGTSLVVIGAMLFLVKPVQADIKMKHNCFSMPNSANLDISITGEINQSDADALQQKLDILTGKLQPKALPDADKLQPKALSNSELLDLIFKNSTRSSTEYGCNAKSVYVGATLNSIGGSVDAAIRLGEIIRSANGNVIVQSGAICYSSCVLVLAAAPRRYIESTAKIGIHRPYFRNALSISDEGMGFFVVSCGI